MSELILSDNWIFLLLALAINMLASFTVFHMIGHQKQARAFRQYWMLNGAAVYGLGLWVAQFIIELATDNMIIMDWTSVFKLVVTIITVYLAFRLLRSESMHLFQIIGSTVLMMAAIASVGFICLLGGSVQEFIIDRELNITASLISFSGTFVSFYIFTKKQRFNLLAGIILGITSMVVQMLNVDSLVVAYDVVLTADRLREYMGLLVIVLGIATAIIFGFSWLARFVDQRYSTMNERYKLLVENSIDMIAIIRDGRWEYVNRSGFAMFEAESKDDFLGRSIYLYLQPNFHHVMKKMLRETERELAPAPVELEWFTVKGRAFYTEVVPARVRLPGTLAYQVIIRDISERKKNEELLINSEKLYVAGQLAAGIAHEIRNPLTSLKGFLQLLASGRHNSKNYFDIMKSELNRIESIVSEMLMLSKPQVYDLTCNDVRLVMRDTVTLLEAQAILHSIELDISCGDEPLWVHGVENQLKQVFINVLKNAIEAMSDGGLIRIICMREEEEIIVRIQDGGPGISDEQLAKMGQPFYTTKDKGTGLGLMVSYKIVDNHNGRITVDSALGNGTTFDIILPYNSPQLGEADAEFAKQLKS
ncbi:ATP-binding protein [Paenibacillus sp. GCM10027626]|uniref:ATP-binding protein n=1 Tax=Paenibacillus sp. GCM10027626 TaxID=3273411 RepID=UPI0036326507